MTTITAPIVAPHDLTTHWITRLFEATPGSGTSASAGSSTRAGRPSGTDRIGARAAYQAALYGRARIVDTRPVADRARDGFIHPELVTATIETLVAGGLGALAGDLPVYVVGPAAFSGLSAPVRVVDGGFAAWRAAGLPHLHAGAYAA